ncbi:hypothetical protein D5770_23665 [Salmonella enterica subsp. enterica]|nr:hypothetical protein [Salmonella enterica subsp. enterica]
MDTYIKIRITKQTQQKSTIIKEPASEKHPNFDWKYFLFLVRKNLFLFRRGNYIFFKNMVK